MTFEEAAQLTRSEKVTLVTMKAEAIAKLFDLYSGSIYSRNVDYHVDLIKQNGDSLVSVSSLGAVTEGTFFYSFTEKKVYFRLFGSVSPIGETIGIVYKFFFANAPLILPHDLASGEEIEWLPYVESIGSVGQTLDDENTGIVLESQSNVKMLNSEAYFDEIYDSMIWENKQVQFYSWFPVTNISEHRQVFDGVVESKDFEPDSVSFNVKDFVYRLRDFVNLDLFTTADGNLTPSLLDTPKRRIYGQVKQVRLAGIDQELEGIAITGLVSIDATTANLVGTGTSFLSDLAPGDEIIFTIDGVEYKFGIEEVLTNTTATLNNESEFSIVNETIKNKPAVKYRSVNRVWHIAGHMLRSPLATITTVISNNRFEVDSTQDMFAGDRLSIGADLISIRRISGNEIVTENAISPLPLVNDVLAKLPIQNVYFKEKKLIYLRDWTYTNTATDAYISINSLAEFNITQDRLLGVSVTFTNGSRSITTSSVVDFRSILKTNDWIRKNSIVSGENDHYEILTVKEQEIVLRAPFTGSTQTTTAYIKVIDHIEDDSIITCDCLGMEVAGSWIKTPSDAVRHLILNDAEFGAVDEISFAQAKADCDYILSMVIPESLEGEPPAIRDVITKINDSCFGSLYGNSSLSISYSILNSVKPETSEVLTDHDILSFNSSSTTDIKNKVKVLYRPFVDFFTGTDTFDVINYNSGFVDTHIGIKATEERTLYLYETDKAEIIAQRIALFKSMTNTKVTLKGKMNLFLNVVNDKIFVNLERLYKRFGGGDRLKIGIVTSVKRSQTETELVISDLGNIFNRVPSIAPNTASDYSGAGSEDKARWGYILNNNSLTPNASSESGLGNGIIG